MYSVFVIDMRNINGNQSGCNVSAVSSVWKFKLESLVFLMDCGPLHKKNLDSALLNAPIILTLAG